MAMNLSETAKEAKITGIIKRIYAMSECCSSEEKIYDPWICGYTAIRRVTMAAHIKNLLNLLKFFILRSPFTNK